MFQGEHLLEKTINAFVDGLHPGELLSENKNISKQIVINEKSYNVLGNFVKMDNEPEESYILLLYFIENTEIVDLKKRYNEEKVAIGSIIIDNYDELMQSMDDAARPQMLAEIDKKVVQWMGFTSGVLKKYERDKYLFVFEYKYLKEMEDKKFEVLDTVKEINLGNKIPVTLSIGFGINGKSILDNFYSAGACLDIALGRGGDQVVIKNCDKFSFYGGRTRELEKRTRVKARVIAYALRELMDQANEVLIMGHQNPDIDALGSALGLYRIAKSRNKNAFIVLSKSNPSIDSLVARIQKNTEYDGIFLNYEDALDRVDAKTLLIVVDTFKPGFTEMPELLEHTGQVVVIDHHRKGADFIQDTVLTYQ